MIDTLHVSFRPGVSVREVDEDAIVLESNAPPVRLANLSPGLKAALGLLLSPAASEGDLYEVAEQIDRDFMSGCRVLYYLPKLRKAGLLQYSLKSGTKLLATIQSLDDDKAILPAAISPSIRLVLSRFAYLRNRDGEAVLESPLSQARIAIYDEECFNTIFRLMRPHTCQQLFVDRRALSQHEMQAFIELLYALSIVREAGDEDAGESRNWEFHDMVFHTRTRLWRHESPIGATFRFGLKSPRVPALKPHMATECVKLFRPDIESLTRKDMPFTEVLEGRRSLRDDSGRVICLDRLGEFLYRAARVRSSTRYANAENELVVTDRPYPNAGACYELEIYILIERCEGISPGLYHYRPDSHELCGVCADKSCLEQMVQDARVATHGTVPQVMLIVAARFARVFWKYEGIAYSLILKNVGVLLQTMYLVATAMGLRPCAIGAGNSRLFSAATRINGLAESSVGEFILNE